MLKTKLKFAKGNAKLDKQTAIFNLPAGHSCPGALLCLSMANRLSGKLTDGKQTQFRCYAATAENLFTNIRVSRWRNFDALRKTATLAGMTQLIANSLPMKNTQRVRIHASGDFFNQTYFDAWLAVARQFPNILFYAYTKMLPFWVARKDSIPGNFRLVASAGGKWDNLIELHNLRYVKVVFSETEAMNAGLKIDHDDSLAYQSDRSFALLLHGTQPKGSQAGKLLYQLRKQGKGGYKADYFAHYKKSAQQTA